MRRIVIAVVILMSFRTLQYFPGMPYVQELWFVLCLLAFATVYPMMKTRMDWRFLPFELYVLLLIPVAILLPAWSSWYEFGQPFVYGILTQRSVILITTCLFFLNALRLRLIKPSEIESALLMLAWSMFAIYSTMRLFLNPANFISYGPGFVVGYDNNFAFQFSGWFLIYGVGYYFLLGLRLRRLKYYGLAALLFIGSVGHSGRFSSLSIALTLLFFLYRSRRVEQATISLTKFCVLAIIICAAAYLISPDFISKRGEQFSDALTVVFKGTQVEDVSANVRILETGVATTYIKKHPLIGNGVLSNQWNGGANAVIGDYLYATDIGVIGVMYSYGILGILIFAYQFWFAWKAASRLPKEASTLFSEASKAFLFYLTIFSLGSGAFVFNAEIPLFFIGLLSALPIERVGSYSEDKMSQPLTVNL